MQPPLARCDITWMWFILPGWSSSRLRSGTLLRLLAAGFVRFGIEDRELGLGRMMTAFTDMNPPGMVKAAHLQVDSIRSLATVS